jgi:hypothetical protein
VQENKAAWPWKPLRFRGCSGQALAAHLEYYELGIFKHLGDGDRNRCRNPFGSLPHDDVGDGKPLGKELQNHNLETLNVIGFLTKDAQPGDVVLPGDNLLAPTLALTKCRVPIGYFSNYIVG